MFGILEFEDYKDFEDWLFRVPGDKNAHDADEIFLWTDETRQVADWLVQILTNWEEHAAGISRDQQNTVIWRICGNPLLVEFLLCKDSVLDLDEKVKFLGAAKCLTLSIPQLFAAELPMENGYFMWWGNLASGLGSGDLGGACLQILEELSLHPDGRVQVSALHGLGHLRHPGSRSVVERFILANPDSLDKTWVQQCLDGTVM